MLFLSFRHLFLQLIENIHQHASSLHSISSEDSLMLQAPIAHYGQVRGEVCPTPIDLSTMTTARIILLRSFRSLAKTMCSFLLSILPKTDCDELELVNGGTSADLSSLFDFFAHSSTCADKTGPLQSFISKLKPALRKVRKKRNLFAHGHSLLPHEIEDCLKAVRLLIGKFSKKQEMEDNQGKTTALKEREPMSLRELVVGGLNSWPKENLGKVNVLLDSPPSSVSRLLYSTAQDLIGQDQLLQRLESFFQKCLEETADTTQKEAVRLLLHGPPGVGKTALVRALAAQLERSFPEQHSFQASTEATLKADVVSFMEGLVPIAAVEGSSWKNSFRRHLSQTQTRMLLVFEDVRSPSLVMSLLPRHKHLVVFTSFSELAWIEEGFQIPEQVTTVPVQGLSIENAMNLLQHVALKFGDRKKVDPFFSQIDKRRELCAFLTRTGQNTPLAIRLVAFQLCHRGGDNLREVLEELEAKEGCLGRSVEDQKAAGPVHVRGFHHVVRYTMEMLSGNKTAVALSYAFCLLPSDGVARWFVDLLGFHLGMKVREIEYAVNVLVQAGLVTAKEQTLVMHHAIQKEVRELLVTAGDETRNFVAASIISTIESKVMAKGGPGHSHGEAVLFSSKCFANETEYIVYLERRMDNWISLELERVAESFLKHSTCLRLSKTYIFRCIEYLGSLLNRRGRSTYAMEPFLWPHPELQDAFASVYKPHSSRAISENFSGQCFIADMATVCTDRDKEQFAVLSDDASVEVFVDRLLSFRRCMTVFYLAWMNVSVSTLLEVYRKGKNFRIITLLSRAGKDMVELYDPGSAEKVLFSILEAGSDHFTRECISWEDLLPILELIDNVATSFYEQSLFSKSVQWWEVSYLLLNLIWGWHQPTTRVLTLCLNVLRRIREQIRSDLKYSGRPFNKRSFLPVFVVWLHRGLAIDDNYSLTSEDSCLVVQIIANAIDVLPHFKSVSRVPDLIDKLHNRLMTWINKQSQNTAPNDSGLRVLKDAFLLLLVVHLSNPTDSVEKISKMFLVEQLIKDLVSGSRILPKSQRPSGDLQSWWKKLEYIVDFLFESSRKGEGVWPSVVNRVISEHLGSQMSEVCTSLSMPSEDSGGAWTRNVKTSIGRVIDVLVRHLKSNGSHKNMLEHFQRLSDRWDKDSSDVLRTFLYETLSCF